MLAEGVSVLIFESLLMGSLGRDTGSTEDAYFPERRGADTSGPAGGSLGARLPRIRAPGLSIVADGGASILTPEFPVVGSGERIVVCPRDG